MALTLHRREPPPCLASEGESPHVMTPTPDTRRISAGSIACHIATNDPMRTQLLSLALTVDQHDQGDYFWALLESFDHSMEFETLMESMHGFPTYVEALDAGFAAMKALSEDLSSGPREELPVDDEFDERDEDRDF